MIYISDMLIFHENSLPYFLNNNIVIFIFIVMLEERK